MADVKPIGTEHIVTPVLPVAQTAHVHPRVTPPATIMNLSPVAVSLAHQAAGTKSTDQLFAEQDRKKLVGLIKRILKDEGV